MDLTPREIQDKQFHDAFRGYDHEEVDLFLDEVAASFDRVYRENQDFHHRLNDLESQLQQARGSEEMLKRMLVTAQETADKAVNEAKARAEETVKAADARAAEIVQQAQSQAKKAIDEATAKATEVVSSAVERERELQVSIEALKKWDAEYRARIKAFIESQLRTLQNGPAEPPVMQGVGATASGGPQSEPANSPRAVPPGREEEVVQTRESAPRPGTNGGMPTEAQTIDVVDPGKVSEVASVSAGGEPKEKERSIRDLFWGEE